MDGWLGWGRWVDSVISVNLYSLLPRSPITELGSTDPGAKQLASKIYSQIIRGVARVCSVVHRRLRLSGLGVRGNRQATCVTTSQLELYWVSGQDATQEMEGN